MKNVRKRFLSALLALALVLALVPVTALADDDYSSVTALKDAVTRNNVVITLGGDIQLTSKLVISGNNVTLDLKGHTITGATGGTSEADRRVIDVLASNVTITNGKIKASADSRHLINVWGNTVSPASPLTEITLSDLTLDRSDSREEGAPLVITGAAVTLGGKMNFTLSDQCWYAINVDSRNVEGTSLTFNSNIEITFDNPAGKDLIKAEDVPADTNALVNFEYVGLIAEKDEDKNPIYNLPVLPSTPDPEPERPYIYPPVVLAQPQAATATEGGVASFSVSAVNPNNPWNPNDLSIRWMISYDGGTVWREFAVGPTAELPVTLEENGMLVQCRVNNGVEVRLEPVTVTVLPGATIVPGDEEIVEPGGEEGDVQEGTEETVPEEGEVPEEGLEELPEEGEDLPEEPVDVPQTGDAASSIGLALVVLGLAACVIVLKKAMAK